MATRSFCALRKSLRQGELLIPNFQRKFVWNVDDMKKLLVSMILKYPTGSLLIGTNADSKQLASLKPISLTEEYAKKIYAEKASIEELNDAELLESTKLIMQGKSFRCEYLLDGQQRLSALDIIFSDAYSSCYEDLHYDKAVRWFLDIRKLGFLDLEFPDNLIDTPYSDALDMVVTKEFRKSKDADYYPNRDATTLRNYCMNPERNGGGYLIPLDMVYEEIEDGYKVSNITYSYLRMDKNLLVDLHKWKNHDFHEDELPSEILQEYEEKLDAWDKDFNKFLDQILQHEFLITEVPSKEFSRLAGIFSVINITGVSLSTFDLLLAQLIKRDENIRDTFCNNIKTFNQNLQCNNILRLIPSCADISNEEDIKKFWSLSRFLKEKKNGQDIDTGDTFPEKIASSYSQLMAIMANISCVLGSDWANREDPLSQIVIEYSGRQDINDGRDAARAILCSLGEQQWGFSDKIILEQFKPEELHNVKDQAAIQIQRAYFLLQAKFGFPYLTSLPYRILDIVLASVLTDNIWESIIQEPTGRKIKKLERWFWSSIFGGAYKNSQDRRVKFDIPRLLVYLNNDAFISWSDVSDLSTSNLDERYESRLKENISNREDNIFSVPGYSDFDALQKRSSKAMAESIRAFIIKDGVTDFSLDLNEMIHAGRDDLEADHIFSLKAWVNSGGERVSRNQEHILNSPLNSTWISSEKNKDWSSANVYEKLLLNELYVTNDEERKTKIRLHLKPHFLDEIPSKEDYNAQITQSSDANKMEETLGKILKKRFDDIKDAVIVLIRAS